MTDIARMRQLQEQIVGALLDICRSLGLASVEMNALTFDGSTSLGTRNPAITGPAGSIRSPAAVFDPLEELREICYLPGRGTWLSVQISVQSTGQFEFDFNYDQRPYTYSREPDLLTPAPGDNDPAPNDQTLLEDLEQFPRDPDALPDWYPRPRVTADDPTPLVPTFTVPVSSVFGKPVSATAGLEDRIQQLEAGIVRTLRRVCSTMDLPRVVFTFAGLNGTGTATLYDPASVAGGALIGFADSSYRRLDADELPMGSLLELRDVRSQPGTGAWFSRHNGFITTPRLQLLCGDEVIVQ